MKDRRSTCSSNGVSRSFVTRTNYSNNVTGLKSVKISKKSSDHQDPILHRLRENLLYFELYLLIPPRSTWEQSSHGNTAITTAAKVRDLEPRDIPAENEEVKMIDHDDKHKEDQKDSNITVVFESSEEPFIPSITIRKIEAGSLLIQAVVLKDLALTSVLFRILEEEKEGIDIVSENHYRTENKVAYTIQVKVQEDYNIDVLEKKLCTWAGKQTRLLHSS